jgi:hypothetical protein
MSDRAKERVAVKAAVAISAYIVAVSYRMAHSPHAPVPQDEQNAYNAMRDALAVMVGGDP